MKTLTFRIHPVTLGLAILIGLPTIAIAAGTILTPPVTVTGSQSGALLTATNQGSGGQAIALMGKSPLGRGVVGETSFNSTSTKDREGGVVGIDSSASGAFNAGVRGNSRVGSGVQGVSTSSNGVDGQTSSTTGAFGVLGEDLNKSFNGNIGVIGKSTLGTGVKGSAPGGVGVFASTGSGTALVAQTANGSGTGEFISAPLGLDIQAGHGLGIEVSANTPIVATNSQSCSNHSECGNIAITAHDTTAQGTGLFAHSDQSTALLAQSDGGANSAVIIRSSETPGPGAPAVIDVGGSQGEFMQFDIGGNLTISGTLTQGGAPMATVRSSSGKTEVSYLPRLTSPVVEDFGEAQLVSGRAFVALELRFAAMVDRTHPYLVFITPLGDTNGLFVQSKSASGFEVVESRGGRSNLTFDYRIVAKPYDSNGARLPAYVRPRPKVE